jgi:hypothetical protein
VAMPMPASIIATLRPKTAGQAINLGGADAAGTLGLTAAELNRITAGTLRIGDSTAGLITISQAISPSGTSTLDLVSGAGVTQTATPLAAATPVSVANLAIQAGGTVDLQAASNDVDQLAVQTSSGHIRFTDSDGLAVGTVNGLDGIVATAGSVSLTSMTGDVEVSNTSAANDLEVTADWALNVNLLGAGAKFTVAGSAVVYGTGGANFVADRIDLTGSLNAGPNRSVNLSPWTNGWQINLGSTSDTAPNTLELSDAELDRITGTGGVLIGSTSAGAIHVSQSISPASLNPLVLTTASSVSQSAAILVGGLAVTAGGNITLNHSDNDVFAFAAKATTGDIVYVDRNDLVVGFVYSVQGIDADNGNVQVSSLGGNFRVANTPAVNDIEATGAVNLSTLGDESMLTISALAKIQASAGSHTYTADKMDLQGTVTANTLSLVPAHAGKQINLGSTVDTAPSTLELSDAELDRITASVIQIGMSTGGAISITKSISPANANTLHLVSGSTITQPGFSPREITVSQFAAEATGEITLGVNNDFGKVAARSTTAAVYLNDANGMTVGEVDGLNQTSAATNLTLVTQTGNLTVENTSAIDEVVAVNLSVTLYGTEGVFEQLAGSRMSASNQAGIAADKMKLGGQITTGTFGTVFLQPRLAGLALDLGSATDNAPNTLELSDAELSFVTGGTLTIGQSTSGIIVSAPIAAEGAGRLWLKSSGGLTQTAPITQSWLIAEVATSLVLDGANDVELVTLASTAGSIVFRDVDGFVATRSDGNPAVNAPAGSVTLTSLGGVLELNRSNDGNALVAAGPVVIDVASDDAKFKLGQSRTLTSAGSVTITADKMDLAGSISAAGQIVTLRPWEASDAIVLGSATDTTNDTLELSAAELDRITAGVLTIGSSNAGAIMISQAIDTANVNTLALITGGSIFDGNAAGTDLIVINLTLQSGNGIGATDQLEIDATNLSAVVTAAGAINLRDLAGGLIVNSATTSSGTIALSADPGGSLSLVNVMAGNGGAVTVTALGSLYLGSVGTTGSASLTSAGAIEELGVDTAADITAGTLSFSASYGIGEVGQLEIDAETLIVNVSQIGSINLNDVGGELTVASATTFNGPITINANSGSDLILTSVTAGNGGAVTLSGEGSVHLGTVTTSGGAWVTSSGTILDSNGSAGNVFAATLIFSATVGIGSTSDPIETAVAKLEASGGVDGVFIANTGALTIGGIGSLAGVSATGGNIVLSAASPVVVEEDILGNGHVFVTAGENAMSGDNLTVNSGVAVRSFGGNVALSAGDAVNLNTGSTISASGTVIMNIGYADSDSGGSAVIRGIITTSSTVLVIGGNGSDSLTLDFASAELPTAGLNFQGGTGVTDRLLLTNTSSFQTATTAFTGQGAATVSFPVAPAVSYSEVEAMDISGAIAANLVFNLPGTADLPILEDDGVSGNNVSRIQSRNASQSFVSTTFVNPTTSVTVNLGADDGDLLLTTLDSSFNSALTANGQLGDDNITVAARTGSGTYTVDGGTGTNRLVGPNMGYTWTINANNAGFIGVAGGHDVDFSNVQRLVGGSLADKFKFTAQGAISGSIDGGNGNDKVDLGAYTTPLTWNVSGTYAGSVSTFTFSSVEDLASGQANDIFRFLAGTTRMLDGGAGRDALDYSILATSVTANLQTGAATFVNAGASSSVAGIENIFGGAANDILTGKDGQNNILIGNAGNDTLVGGNGRDILIGGYGADTLRGGSGEDILIGGRTNYDSSAPASIVALDSIMAEWNSSRTYKQRIFNISNGTAANSNQMDSSTFNTRQNSNNFLRSTGFSTDITVFDDAAVDGLFGDTNQDWLFSKTSGSNRDGGSALENGEVATNTTTL